MKSDMALRRFYCGPGRDEQSALQYLFDKGVLPSTQSCEFKRGSQACRSSMYLGKRKSSDGLMKPIWRCRKNGCNSKRSVRVFNKFLTYTDANRRPHSRLQLHVIMEVVYLYLYTKQTLRESCFNIGVTMSTLVDWHCSIRMTCGKALEQEPRFVGTEACPVMIDEAHIAGRAMYRRGRPLQGDIGSASDDYGNSETDDAFRLPEWGAEDDDDDDEEQNEGTYMRFGEDAEGWKWVVGLSNGKGRVRFARVPNRSANTLNAIISKYVTDGSVIYSDGWKGYAQLEQLGYKHKTVIHKENFVDPASGAHTQEIERWWVEVRAWWKRARGNKKMLQTHLDFMSWMAHHNEKKGSMELFHQFFADVKIVHG